MLFQWMVTWSSRSGRESVGRKREPRDVSASAEKKCHLKKERQILTFMPKSQSVQQLMNNIPQMTMTLTPPQIHIGPLPRLLPKIRSTHPLIMHLMIKINIFHLIRAGYELNYACRLFNVLYCQLDGGECFGVEPGGVGFDGVGNVELAVWRAEVGGDGP